MTLSEDVCRLLGIPTEDLVKRYIDLRFREQGTNSLRSKERFARQEVEIAAVLHDRKRGLTALELGLKTARLKS